VEVKTGERLLAYQPDTARAPPDRPPHGHQPWGPDDSRPRRGAPPRLRRRRTGQARSEPMTHPPD